MISSEYFVLAVFLIFSYSILKAINVSNNMKPKVKKGEWDPFLENENNSNEIVEYRDQYYDLLEKEPKNNQKLGQLLMRRAISVIDAAVILNENRMSMSNLFKRGCIGEEVWPKVNQMDSELGMEIEDIQNEANFLKEGYGAAIMDQARQLWQLEKQKKMEAEMSKLMEEQKKISQTQDEKMKVLEREEIKKNAEELIRMEEKEKKKGNAK